MFWDEELCGYDGILCPTLSFPSLGWEMVCFSLTWSSRLTRQVLPFRKTFQE